MAGLDELSLKDYLSIFTKKQQLESGTIIKSTGSWYKVMDIYGKTRDCRIRGKLRLKGIKSTNPVAVGDEVEFELEEDQETGVIKKILPRKNYIIRKSINLSKRSHILAANIDRVYLVVTLVAPQTQTGFIDRFLVSAEAYHIPVVLLFNKIDLFEPEDLELLEEFMSVYKKAGYRCETISAKNANSVEFLLEEIKGNKVMFGGHSGVGKSTLINTLDPNLDLKIGEISYAHMTGTHTTTFAEMFPLETGGYIIDTPGIRAFGLIDFEKKELSHYFPEMRNLLNDCKFNDCQHINEPDCAIKIAVKAGIIDAGRYYNYVRMIEEDEDETYRKDEYK